MIAQRVDDVDLADVTKPTRTDANDSLAKISPPGWIPLACWLKRISKTTKRIVVAAEEAVVDDAGAVATTSPTRSVVGGFSVGSGVL